MAQGLLKSNRSRDGIAAILAQNIGDLEGDMWQLQEDWNTKAAELLSFEEQMSQAGLRVLNTPNLLKQNFWTTRNMPTSAVISQDLTVPVEDATAAAADLTFTITNAAITSSYVLHGVKCTNWDVVSYSSVSCSAGSGSATITITARSGAHNAAVTVTVYLCTVSNQKVPYGQTSRISGSSYPYLKNASGHSSNYPGDDSTDNVTATIVTVKPAAYSPSSAYAVGAKCSKGGQEYQCNTAIGNGGEAWNASHWTEIDNEWITEIDGEEYGELIQFVNSTAMTNGWLNSEDLIFNHGYGTNGDQGLPNMEDGEIYTMSCWARITSGTKAMLCFRWGQDKSLNAHGPSKEELGQMVYKPIEISGSGWQRVQWQFTYHASMTWTETYLISGVETPTSYTRAYGKRVSFGMARKYAATVQLCGFRLVKGKMWITDTYSDLVTAQEALRARMTAAESALLQRVQWTYFWESFANLASQEDGDSSAAAHTVGEILVVGTQLYRVTAAIAIGDSITDEGNSANVEAVTVAELIDDIPAPDTSSLAPKASPAFTGSISLERKSNTTVGTNSMAVGTDTEAAGLCSQAFGYNTSAKGKVQHVSGMYNVQDDILADHDSTVTYYPGKCVIVPYNYRDFGTRYYGKKVYKCTATHSGDTVTGEGVLPSTHWELVYTAPEGTTAPELFFDTINAEIVGIGTSSTPKNGRTLDWSGNEEIAGRFKCKESITIGSTKITEAQLQSLLAMLT